VLGNNVAYLLPPIHVNQALGTVSSHELPLAVDGDDRVKLVRPCRDHRVGSGNRIKVAIVLTTMHGERAGIIGNTRLDYCLQIHTCRWYVSPRSQKPPNPFSSLPPQSQRRAHPRRRWQSGGVF
jgi:hypothetical protein